MHIVHVVSNLDKKSGGPSRSVPQLVDHLCDKGLQISLCFQNRGNEIVEISKNCNRIELPRVGWPDLTGIRKNFQRTLGQLQRDRPINLFHLHGMWDGFTNLAAWFARRERIDYIWTPRGMLEPWSLKQKRIKKKIAWLTYQKTNLRHAIAAHATAEMEAENLNQLGLTIPKFVIPNGIPRTPEVDLSNRQSDPRIALFLSRIHPKKGIELLIDAWQALKPANWICHLVGPGERGYLDSLRARIESAGLTGKIMLLPPLDDDQKWEAYERASLFVLPTYSENFGIVVAEALAMRVPVITTTGTPWSMLPAKNCGWYISPNTPQLLEALKIAFEIPAEQLQKMGDNGCRFAKAEYGWENIAKQFLAKYHEFQVNTEN